MHTDHMKQPFQPQPPDQLVARVWKELTRACKDRHHHWRTPVLASMGSDGSAQARTVVLRQADAAASMLYAYTDARSPKCAELHQDHRAQLVFWSERLRWQLRVTVHARVETEGERVQQAWAAMRQSPSARDYLSDQAPGALLMPHVGQGGHIANDQSQHHLAVLCFQVQCMDWLALGREGHQRAHIDIDGGVTALCP